MKTIYDIMDDGDSCLLSFDMACDDLTSGKLILAEKKIQTVLKVIAGSKKLYALVENCMRGFEFAPELARAKKTESGRQTIVLPSSSRKNQIAFVFCLLFSFDTKKLDFQSFVHTYFYSDSPAHEFELFCKSIIVPFRQNVGLEFLSEDDTPFTASESDSGAGKTESVSQNRAAEQSESAATKNLPQVLSYGHEVENINESRQGNKSPDKYSEGVNFSFDSSFEDYGEDNLDELAVTALLSSVREIIGIVARSSELTTDRREELMIICEALEKAIEFGGMESIKVMYIAIKNTIACSPIARQLQLQFDSLRRLAEEYGII